MKPQAKPLHLAQIIALLFAAPAAFAADDTAPQQAKELETVIVKGERSRKPEQTVITDKELQRAAAQNIDDSILYEPGVDVRSDNLQHGHSGYVIRGMGGNRIQMDIDGIPLPDSHEDLTGGPGASPETSVNRDTVETDTLKRISISKNANAAENGAGALGGTVAMRTYSPSDFVSSDKPLYLGLKYGYRSTYRSHGITATLAGKHDIFAGMLMLTRRRLHEAENYAENDGTGARRTVSNQQKSQNLNVLAKGEIAHGAHRGELAFEQFLRDTHTERLEKQGSGRGSAGWLVRPVSNGDDKYNRRRLSIGYRYQPESGWVEKISAQAYRQAFDVYNVTQDHVSASRTPGAPPYLVQNKDERRKFEQRHTGVSADIAMRFQTGSLLHRPSFGAEYRQTKTGRLIQQDVSGTQNQQVENRSFPPSDRRVFALYGQNETAFNEHFSINFGLRYHREKTKFTIDDAYRAYTRNQPLAPDSVSAHALLPSLGMKWQFAPGYSWFANYSFGFRSPGPDLIAAGYQSPSNRYRVRPNADLKPEKSRNFETGLSYSGERLNLRTTAFYNRYKDFIGYYTESDPARLPPNYLFEIYYRNIARAKTYGFDISADWALSREFKLSGGLAWMRGVNETSGKPLSNAHPLQGFVGIDYQRESWDVGTRLRWSAKNRRVADEQDFKAPGYGVWDISANYRPHKNVEISAGVYNVLDKRHWRYADVAGVKKTGTIDRYTQPGRNYALGLHLKF